MLSSNVTSSFLLLCLTGAFGSRSTSSGLKVAAGVSPFCAMVKGGILLHEAEVDGVYQHSHAQWVCWLCVIKRSGLRIALLGCLSCAW